MNNDEYLNWTLQDKASKTTEIVVDIVENRLSRLVGQSVVSTRLTYDTRGLLLTLGEGLQTIRFCHQLVYRREQLQRQLPQRSRLLAKRLEQESRRDERLCSDRYDGLDKEEHLADKNEVVVENRRL